MYKNKQDNMQLFDIGHLLCASEQRLEVLHQLFEGHTT